MQDMEQYEKRVKENIEELINNNALEDARKIIKEYEEVVSKDEDIYSFKAVVAMMEGDMEKAEKVLKEGLTLYKTNFDVLYNLGYLYETNNNSELAIKYYKRALKNGENEEIKESVYEILKGLGVEESKEEIIRDVINEEKILLEKSKEETNPHKEMKNLQKQFKENIQYLMEQGLLEEAKGLLNQYKEIGRDADVYSVKGFMAMMEGNMDDAEVILDEGLLIDSVNEDLLYNCGGFYRTIGKFDKSIYFYKKLYNVTKDSKIKYELEKTIKNLGGDIKTRVLIGSPVHQKPRILKEFLQSLKELKKENLEVSYFFTDDNNIQESSDLLCQFKKEERKIYIYKSENDSEYICDDNTHHWKEKLVWKVADFKDKIIQYARHNKFDYLFLIDSDLVLHPNTLKHLISTGKDIISEIFWTRWQPNTIELPQVWLKDIYTQYHVERGENLSQSEIAKRYKNFLEKLKIPGIYKVGGLGACTLISAYAIDKGVSFKEIKNLSFWGEDRHFCIRAMALGLTLYVDTYYPAYHIYREKDLGGVARYKGEKTNPTRKKKISLVYTNLSGSNTIALFKLASQDIREKYEINLVLGDLSNQSLSDISNSDIAIFTEGNYPFNSKIQGKLPIVIDLWHGFPLKAMGYADKGEKFKDSLEKIWNNIDYITSYSLKFNEVMNKCISTNLSKYIITGAQRNDLLFYTDGRKNIEKIFEESFKNKKFIFYMPTYRYTSRGNRSEGKRNWENIFGFESFNINKFTEFLEENNIMFFIKLHPSEESKFINKIPVNKNIRLITNKLLFEKGIDLYEMINSADVLVTDYSSVYFDTLLLDIPIIFIPVDLKEYKNDRGMLLEPYEEWTPGPKCITQEVLQEDIIKFLSEKSYYSKERKKILKKVHKYFDSNSCIRTWKLVDSLLEKRD